jgi:hypothetical protein
MEKLSRYVFQLSLPMNCEDGDRPVFHAARIALLSLPEHAAYFGRALDRAIKSEIDEVRDANASIRVRPNRDEIYETLVQLPSPQIVELLGELLEDERDPWKGQPASDYTRPLRNSFLAAQTLNRIGIEGVPLIEPIKDDRDFEAARDQWKLWFAQVKAGNRTFRFKGDPQEYNLHGPVAAVPAVKLAQQGSSSPGVSSANEVSDWIPSSWIPLVIATLVLIAALGSWLQSRRVA